MRLIIAIIICMIVNVISVEIPPADYFDENIENESCPEVEKAEDEKDLVLIDGDILVSKEQAAIYYESGWDGLVNSEAWSPTKARWSKRIPYQVGAGISAPVTVGDGRIKANVENSIAELNGRTCLSFEAKTCKDTAFIKFVKGDACYTIELGKPNHGARTISLAYSCGGTAKRARTPAHEVMHALGRVHEQTRPDRDKYVTIDARNTCSDQMAIHKDFKTLNIGYDFMSIMHYSQWQCSFKVTFLDEEHKVPSMIFKYEGRADDVGQRLVLSDKDIQHIKAIHCPSMMMRLVGGRDNSEGRLEVNNEEVWGTVCSHGFDRNDANVVCKYLGRPGVEEVYSAAHIQNIQSAQDSPIWMSDLECTGQEDNPFICSQKVMKHHTNCDHNQDVAIRCSKAARLIGGNDNTGRLEVYHEGKWGSACSHKFGYPEANVACRMMGYSSAVQVFTNEESEYDDDTVDSKIVVSQLKCDGTENHLSDCYIRHAHICHGGKPVYLECSN